MKRLLSAHLLGNAMLLLLGYYWLGMGESDALHLAFSAAVILCFVLGAIWLHSTALVFFRDSSWLRASRILPLFLISILVFLVYWALQYFDRSFGHEAFNIGSYSTMKLRRPVEPEKVLWTFHGFIWLLRWFVVPGFALPLAAEVADRGWQGLRKPRVLFCAQTGIFLLAAIELPLYLFFWIPKMAGFSLEVISVSARIGLGYLLFTAGLLAAEYFTSAGKPRVTQPSTAVSP